MIVKESIIQIVDSYLSDSEYYLVDVHITNDNRIQIEIDSFEGVSLDYCVQLSKHVESQLDREAEDFELEVSSAGLTEPFKVLKQYEKNLGNEVEVLTKDGRKLSGLLKETNENAFVVQITKSVKPEGAKRKVTVEEDLTFNYSEVKHTKYIIRFK